jgi:hypothetical protein
MMEKPYTDIPISTLEEWSETKDQALAAHYLCELGLALTEREVYLDKVKEIDSRIENLNFTFGHLRDKYPEEFV